MRQQRVKREWLSAARKLQSSGVPRGTYSPAAAKAMSAGDASTARKARMTEDPCSMLLQGLSLGNEN